MINRCCQIILEDLSFLSVLQDPSDVYFWDMYLSILDLDYKDFLRLARIGRDLSESIVESNEAAST